MGRCTSSRAKIRMQLVLTEISLWIVVYGNNLTLEQSYTDVYDIFILYTRSFF